MLKFYLTKPALDVKESKMCVHYWMIDSNERGVCKKCGKEKDFSEPLGRLTRKEVQLVHSLIFGEYYMQGTLRVNGVVSK